MNNSSSEAATRGVLKLFLRNLPYSQENPSVGASFNKVVDVQARSVVKKRLQNRCFPVNITKSLREPNYFIFIIIWERLLLPLKVICKDFVDSSYEKASFGILEDSIWLQLIYFLAIIAFSLMKYIFRIDGDNLRVLTKDMTEFIAQVSHYENLTDCKN